MIYNPNTVCVEISVEELCRLAMSGGDLGGYKAELPSDASVNRGEVCEVLQRALGVLYRPQEELLGVVSSGGLSFEISGRADGIFCHAEGWTADTVLFVKGKRTAIVPNRAVLARMQCYAYLLALRENLSEVRARLTVYPQQSKKPSYFFYRYSVEELGRNVRHLLQKIERYAKQTVIRQTETLPSAASSVFPYPELREGQEMMIRETYGAIRHGRRIFIQAPTGIGKTVSSLYPAVRALGEGRIDKIFYLTAKASTGREAYRAAAKLHAAGAAIKVITMTAKEQMCLCAKRFSGEVGRNLCNPTDCEYAEGYYDRVSDAVCELLENGNGFPRQLIVSTAQKYRICPYELSLDLSEWCDVIICDYNYAFDPIVEFRRYFSGRDSAQKYAFLIDEAHNLPDRVGEMYSATLRRSDLERLAAEFGAEETLWNVELEAVISAVSRLKTLCRDELVKDAEGHDRGFYLSRTPLVQLNRELEIFQKKCEVWLKRNRLHEAYGKVWDASTRIRKYLRINEFFGEGFLCYAAFADGDVVIRTYCLNPSALMDPLLNRASSVVLFSATLTPPEYFCEVLDGSRRAQSIDLPSPFPPEHLCVAVADYVSLRAEERSRHYGQYATVIAATVSAKPGNYMAYFPSYACLEGVLKAFCRKYPQVEVIVQKQNMGNREREEFLGAFQNDVGRLRVGFCVLGGAFSEGVDLPGSRLIGTVIFGVGLPGLSNERNIMRDYFDTTLGEGYDYAYTYPGMNRVLQAAGRVIRRDSDCGVVVLVDDRYALPKYRRLFPRHWQEVQYAGNARSLAEIMRRFWEKEEKNR